MQILWVNVWNKNKNMSFVYGKKILYLLSQVYYMGGWCSETWNLSRVINIYLENCDAYSFETRKTFSHISCTCIRNLWMKKYYIKCGLGDINLGLECLGYFLRQTQKQTIFTVSTYKIQHAILIHCKHQFY